MPDPRLQFYLGVRYRFSPGQIMLAGIAQATLLEMIIDILLDNLLLELQFFLSGLRTVWVMLDFFLQASAYAV